MKSAKPDFILFTVDAEAHPVHTGASRALSNAYFFFPGNSRALSNAHFFFSGTSRTVKCSCFLSSKKELTKLLACRWNLLTGDQKQASDAAPGAGVRKGGSASVRKRGKRPRQKRGQRQRQKSGRCRRHKRGQLLVPQHCSWIPSAVGYAVFSESVLS